MDITIRQAQPADAEQAAPLIIDAIGDIAKRMTGETEWDKVEQELCVLFKRKDNRHSHLYTYIAELDGKVAGIMVLYAGSDAPKLDQNLSEWLSKKGATNSEVDAESLADELYIDTVCIDPAFRGKGIGTKLFEYAEEVARQKNSAKLSLNVETEKEPAIRLYKRIGYEIVSPWTIIGEPFHHMVKII
ncbi:GNAT family N-acetyltransferase [Sporosarcina sp. E16_8]|uniref:GNAT family N-acetyltransferase n=1 Tax=Sporosarcina sp. E16_8 TaxID=2789295 RepID=UPI001A914AA5|nr:GNAT family N-acetyltransferase [Sporosarcina sp. E16_8]MBO0586635.1 GNAT family N-acetyltransferase [Sporosarcina sp. E16_8]